MSVSIRSRRPDTNLRIPDLKAEAVSSPKALMHNKPYIRSRKIHSASLSIEALMSQQPWAISGAHRGCPGCSKAAFTVRKDHKRSKIDNRVDSLNMLSHPLQHTLREDHGSNGVRKSGKGLIGRFGGISTILSYQSHRPAYFPSAKQFLDQQDGRQPGLLLFE